MDREEIMEVAREVARETVAELKRQNLLKDDSYFQAKEMIIDYYAGVGSEEVGKAINSLSKDRFFKILPGTFRDGYTQEQLAVVFDCETSTIVRNKKRLCLEVLRRTK